MYCVKSTEQIGQNKAFKLRDPCKYSNILKLQSDLQEFTLLHTVGTIENFCGNSLLCASKLTKKLEHGFLTVVENTGPSTYIGIKYVLAGF